MDRQVAVEHNMLLQSEQEQSIILVSRKELETEHSILLARIQQLRRLLGLPLLCTGKQTRKQARQV